MNEESMSKVLVVDDSEENIAILVEALADEYDVSVALDGDQALEMVSRIGPDIILLDIVMPKIDGFDVCAELKKTEETSTIPVLFLTALRDEEAEEAGLNLGAVDFISKPFNPRLVKAKVANHLELKRHRDHLDALVRERTEDLRLTLATMMESLGSLAETRDPETGSHIKRTQHYLKALALEIRKRGGDSVQLDDKSIEHMFMAAPMHDIGKVGVSDSVLLKPGKLTKEEFEEIKKHPECGYRVLERAQVQLKFNPLVSCAAEIAYTHHEKWDASGYPRGLGGEDIPLSGRLMALADVYDALTTKRVYKPAMSHEKAVTIIKEGRATHFDPTIVDAFLNIHDSFISIAREFGEDE